MAKLTANQNKFYEDMILESIDSSGYDIKTKTPQEKLKFLKETFKSEYGFAISRMGEQRAFQELLRVPDFSANLIISQL